MESSNESVHNAALMPVPLMAGRVFDLMEVAGRHRLSEIPVTDIPKRPNLKAPLLIDSNLRNSNCPALWGTI